MTQKTTKSEGDIEARKAVEGPDVAKSHRERSRTWQILISIKSCMFQNLNVIRSRMFQSLIAIRSYMLQSLITHKGKVAAGLGTLMVCGVGWHLNTCNTDKTECVRELRQAYLSHRAADEKFNQGLFAFVGRLKSFNKYVAQDDPELAELEQYQQQLTSLARVANDDCNNAKASFYKLIGSMAEVERYYQLPNFGYTMDVSHKCASISDVAAGGAGMPDIKKLATDKTYRNKYIEEQRPYEKESDELIRIQPQNFKARMNSMENLLKRIDDRASNLPRSIWDCLSLPFAGKRKI